MARGKLAITRAERPVHGTVGECHRLSARTVACEFSQPAQETEDGGWTESGTLLATAHGRWIVVTLPGVVGVIARERL